MIGESHCTPDVPELELYYRRINVTTLQNINGDKRERVKRRILLSLMLLLYYRFADDDGGASRDLAASQLSLTLSLSAAAVIRTIAYAPSFRCAVAATRRDER